MIFDEEDYLAHYGILRESGRYPWGSGEDQPARNKMFLDIVDDLKRQGLSDIEICRGFDIKDENGNVTEKFSTTQLRAAKKIANNEQKQAFISKVQQLADTGMSNVEIGKELGKNESTIRAARAPGAKDKADILTTVSNMLKDHVDEKKFLDVGKGQEQHLGISDGMLNGAIAVLKEKGYEVHTVPVEQLGTRTSRKTNVKVLCLPGTTWGDVNRNQSNIKHITSFSEDGGRSALGIKPPIGIDPKRIDIRYANNGGAESDGVLFVRPNVKDVELGGAAYAQVRVKVGDTHFIKGMAVYKSDLPEGVDIQFNTNKDDTGNKLDVLKPLKRVKPNDPPGPDNPVDQDNPFGSTIWRQIIEKDDKGNEHLTSAMNLVSEEGRWLEWNKTLSSQMLSKQTPKLAREQLNIRHEQKLEEYDRISKLTNPEVRRKLLIDFGDSVDHSASHLEAAGLPRTHGHHILLPIASMPPTQIYAPRYRNGERVVLIRHPHGGTFEIPELTVNNKNREAKRLLGNDPKDAVGIHHSVAERLSGADFDGDTVLVIPNNEGKVTHTPALEGLKNFSTQRAYPGYEGMKPMSASTKGNQMGDISNLITDMTIKGAPTSEIVRAIRHSMVVIDAEKHNLNYKLSAQRNGIAQLKEKYQSKEGSRGRGASTLISRAGAEDRIPERKPRKFSLGGPIDKSTGKRVFVETGDSYTNKKGVTVFKTDIVRRLSVTDNAHDLSSGTPMERIYAEHSNRLKALAMKARKEGVNTKTSVYSKSARKIYDKEVKSLTASLELARHNAPLERQAQIIANATYRLKLNANPHMDEDTKKKIRHQALNEARNRTGAGKKKIELSQEQWNAIQAGAVSPTMLRNILDNANMETVKKLATPKGTKLMTTSKINQANSLLKNGATRSEVADRLGVSLSTLDEVLG